MQKSKIILKTIPKSFMLSTSIHQVAQQLLQNENCPVVVSSTGYKALLNRTAMLLKEFSNSPSFFFTSEEDDWDRLLGLNIFFGTIDYCFRNPYTRTSYVYKSKSGMLVKRSVGLFTAMANSDIPWHDFFEVSRLDQTCWEDLVRSESSSFSLFDFHERRERIVSFAKYLISSGFKAANDLRQFPWNTTKFLYFLEQSGLFDDPFYKRSQAVTRRISDIFLKLYGHSPLDTGSLTIMADYRLPQLFYNFGAVEIVDARLLQALEKEISFAENSLWEMTLRAISIEVGHRLAKDNGVSEGLIDSVLWKYSKSYLQSSSSVIPHMLVSTRRY